MYIQLHFLQFSYVGKVKRNKEKRKEVKYISGSEFGMLSVQ